MPHSILTIAAALFSLFSVLATPVFAAGSSDESSTESAEVYAEAKALIDAENYVAALPILLNIIATDAENADAWNLLGFTNRKLGNLDDAALAYSTALTLNPDHLGALEYQGELYLQTGQPDLAKANLTRLQGLCGDCEEAEDLALAVQDAGV
jgi:Flp pilus assembly protein TadD